MDEVLCKPRTYIIAQAENLVHNIVYTKLVRSIVIFIYENKWYIFKNGTFI